jgi:hypothetical protein
MVLKLIINKLKFLHNFYVKRISQLGIDSRLSYIPKEIQSIITTSSRKKLFLKDQLWEIFLVRSCMPMITISKKNINSA